MTRQKLKEAISQPKSLEDNTRIRLPHQHAKPPPQNADIQYRTYHIPNEETGLTVCPVSTCANCKQAICSCSRVFCAKMREPIDENVDCPYFELEPLSYRLFVRT